MVDVGVCSPNHPICTMHAPYFIVNCSLSEYTIIVSPYLINSMRLWKELWSLKCVYRFPLVNRSERFFIQKIIRRKFL